MPYLSINPKYSIYLDIFDHSLSLSLYVYAAISMIIMQTLLDQFQYDCNILTEKRLVVSEYWNQLPIL